MIISHSRQFILVKSRKTASTSLERAIVPHLSAEDVWTPISLPSVEGRNYYSLWPIDLLTAKWHRFRDWAGKDNWLHYRYYYDHMPIRRIRQKLPARHFASYQKYAFDRNPWDFLVSIYFYMRRKGEVSKWDFDRFLHEFPIMQNWDLYTEDGKVAVDKVFRFEELNAAVKNIERDTGLSIGTLPEDKGGYRSDKSYRSFYSPSSRDLVAVRWKVTIELLGYDF
jgi:hypothetical protein